MTMANPVAVFFAEFSVEHVLVANHRSQGNEFDIDIHVLSCTNSFKDTNTKTHNT